MEKRSLRYVLCLCVMHSAFTSPIYTGHPHLHGTRHNPTEYIHRGSRITSPDNIVSEVHSSLLNKVYNARCNEFLQTVRKLSCIDKNQAVDASVGLRDKLKVFATEKCTLTQ